MDALRRYQLTNVGLFAVASSHAALTWRPRATIAVFVGGASIAFVLEAVAIAVGLLEHELTPQVAGVPVTVLLAWPAIVYLTYRVALLLVPAGASAAALAAVLATALDVPTDPNGVREGVWRYPETRISRPRFRDVPWWNFVAWLLIVFATAMLPALVESSA